MIQPERVQQINSRPMKDGHYVLYWMQASQRAEYNHALEYAIGQANRLNKPLVVYFGITDVYPEANERHFHFMLEGLRETLSTLRDRGIQMIIRHESPEIGVLGLAKDACLLIVDAGYLKIQRQWRSYAADRTDCLALQVESDVIVPLKEASTKEEYTAATFRPKIKTRLNQFLMPLPEQEPKASSVHLDLYSMEIEDIQGVLSRLSIDRTVRPVTRFRGGTSEGKRHLREFIERKLDRYSELRNDPNADYLSNMSPYLHFGQISPLYVAQMIIASGSPAKDSYLEELIVRRELSTNFVFYSSEYDSFNGLPNWARRTLSEHRDDQRGYFYTLEDLENAETHDIYWNATQKEMAHAGKMHGYMRMYWGKKILEWTHAPEEAFRIALYLNNKYELDGRDPNGFAGVAWCFGEHDRPWPERPVLGKVRYMSSEGLRRKFDADAYAKKWHQGLPSSVGQTLTANRNVDDLE